VQIVVNCQFNFEENEVGKSLLIIRSAALRSMTNCTRKIKQSERSTFGLFARLLA
jgi:hypothetical protein